MAFYGTEPMKSAIKSSMLLHGQRLWIEMPESSRQWWDGTEWCLYPCQPGAGEWRCKPGLRSGPEKSCAGLSPDPQHTCRDRATWHPAGRTGWFRFVLQRFGTRDRSGCCMALAPGSLHVSQQWQAGLSLSPQTLTSSAKLLWGRNDVLTELWRWWDWKVPTAACQSHSCSGPPTAGCTGPCPADFEYLGGWGGPQALWHLC